MRNMHNIKCAEDLVTSHKQTRAGFIEAALAKNYKAKPYVEQAKTLKSLASRASAPVELLKIPEIQNCLLAASGLSDKSLKYFTEEDKKEAIKKLISEFLEPAGETFIDELVYRFLLIKGDSLGGSMRNYVGLIAQVKLIRKVLSLLSMQKISFMILFKDDKKKNKWQSFDYEHIFDKADEVIAIQWSNKQGNRILFFNATIPLVKNNIDICLYQGGMEDFNSGNIVKEDDKAILLGELKGGIDPAGADEHWKTGNSALERIREAFARYSIKTSFIAAAIEKKMATEIYAQLQDGTLQYAANLTVDGQLTAYCNWMINL
ncbi:MAG TPA: type II restriction endonuclease [Candidatus Barnesiella excrementigallinarum]|nr:type II restriction endonuclease [Candidatus Barnesiella excrementigallinarum]